MTAGKDQEPIRCDFIDFIIGNMTYKREAETMEITDSYLMSLFKPRIWRRGEDINESDKVTVTQWSLNEIHANKSDDRN